MDTVSEQAFKSVVRSLTEPAYREAAISKLVQWRYEAQVGLLYLTDEQMQVIAEVTGSSDHL